MLTDQIATDEFHPENYKDEVKERVEGLIRRKIDGQEISESAPEAPRTQVIDLMAALKASLAARGGRKGASKAETALVTRSPSGSPRPAPTRVKRSPGPSGPWQREEGVSGLKGPPCRTRMATLRATPPRCWASLSRA